MKKLDLFNLVKFDIMKKIEHVWSIICSNSTTDQQTNNISLFNVVEKFNVIVEKKPNLKIEKNKKIIIPFGQEVVTRFRRKVRDVDVLFDIRLDLIDPSGEITEGKTVKTISFLKKFSNMRVVNKVPNLPVEKSGLYNFSIKIREVGETKFEEVGSIPLEINTEIKQ